MCAHKVAVLVCAHKVAVLVYVVLLAHIAVLCQVLVLRWDGKTEDLTSEGVSSEMAERIKAGLKELDSGLGAYPYDSLKKWTSLTSHIEEPLVRRYVPT